MDNLFAFRRPRFFILLIAALLPGVAVAQEAETERKADPRKPAWKWSIEERLAARFDPVAMAAREAEYEAEQEEFRKRGYDPLFDEWAKMTAPQPAIEHLDGRKAPELFLPGELFSTLLRRGLPPEEERERAGLQISRSQIEQRAAALGFGRDLWDRLEKVAASYLKLLYSEDRRRLRTGENDYRKQEDRLRICREYTQAVKAARAEFGEETFLRLLYEAVAPDTLRTYILEGWPPDYHQHADLLRSSEKGGCP